MIDKLIENDQQIVISYVLNGEQELENLLCFIVEFDRENKLVHVETTYGSEYIFPLSVIRQIEIKKRR
ncbi:hypothetical protein J7E63_12830 [Bacillus sp. ISL-75]|uniref:hypothetical protein n=1 Tax=Bacillus sp. ISL-75 TaxID=2819137 RepID=UPI001BE97BC1|nr:hypothetical protein [Bacillus sp. ISL-75]MBT2727823.1 hypothetical protein [Bacillus sp. ISL-75]